MDNEQTQESIFLDLPSDPPPPYTAIEPTERNNFFASITSRLRSNSKTTSREESPRFGRPGKQLQFFLPDPARIKCRCGQHVDTTSNQSGRVICYCGYTVTSSGASFPTRLPHPPVHEYETPRCSCGTALPDLDGSVLPWECTCGAHFLSSDTVKRICSVHGKSSSDPRNFHCPCGKWVDTTVDYTITHGSRSTRPHPVTGVVHSHAGYTIYEYSLPTGSGACSCGRIMSRNGKATNKRLDSCCEVQSTCRKEREGDACTCA